MLDGTKGQSPYVLKIRLKKSKREFEKAGLKSRFLSPLSLSAFQAFRSLAIYGIQ